ncbi:hypothetical protein EXU57_15710 [Segetibacter sp. 3557_3]|uniref:YdeI/OmpD-associated family protein n=1 Tax=Segetibacter sp. 3557_3 TaxID=2547429 RepID=UPI001058B850|nr:YdeI/OmpD-associated family protein [Segetibacter sp. 3557_3]TDH24256.1 hypothetical protein EXU57_15710 [Segetibacter sp. 3557_3]
METYKNIQAVHAPTRKQWREWLVKNHDTENSVWLIIYHKASGTPSVYYAEAVEEALCFGWVDSKGNKRDSESSYLYFARRKPRSNWSKPNRERVERLISEGLMTPAGQKMIDLAKATGTWQALVQIDNLVIPEDLRQAFDQNPVAYQHFMGFSDSAKRMMLEWVLNAKKPETRQNRIFEIVNKAAQNIKAR